MDSLDYHTAGWDIGGAHVKAAYVENHVLIVHQWLCPLWKGIDELSLLLGDKMKMMPEHITRHQVTMTGELVDFFPSRQQGVIDIVNAFSHHAQGSEVSYYSTQGFLDESEAASMTDVIASANWSASAHAVAGKIDHAIFIDMGSTTTDVIKIIDNQLCLQGMTDFERLQTGELIYTGVVRSCVNTIAHHVVYKGVSVPLVAENFANMADVYRSLGELPDHADLGDTMDGQSKDKISSLRRLARMVGGDYVAQDHAAWLAVSDDLRQRQKEKIINKISEILSFHPAVRTLVAAGVGRFLIHQIAAELKLDYLDFSECILPDGINTNDRASDCAPAVALVFS